MLMHDYLISTAITTNKILAGIAILIVLIVAAVFWFRRRSRT
jgi:hypothetical protein